jgi:ribosomal protein S9
VYQSVFGFLDRYLVRDPRCVERKKPGQKKARKKFTWLLYTFIPLFVHVG